MTGSGKFNSTPRGWAEYGGQRSSTYRRMRSATHRPRSAGLALVVHILAAGGVAARSVAPRGWPRDEQISNRCKPGPTAGIALVAFARHPPAHRCGVGVASPGHAGAV